MPRARNTYGLVLVLVAASIVFQMATSGDGGERLITVLLQAATLVAAVRAAGSLRRFVHAAAAIALLVACLATLTLAIDGKLPEIPVAIVSGLLVAVAPAALAAGLLRDVRVEGVTLHTLAGVLAIYLLMGMFFAFVYGAIGAVDAQELFAEIGASSPADRLYFSFVTLCTVGYGDIVPVGDVAKTVAVSEMLIGQIYLVTVVAVIVSNLGHRRPA
jgi:Ion channel